MTQAAADRKAARWALRDWQTAAFDVRAMYRRIARRWIELDDLTLWEFADAYGVRRDFLCRAAAGLGLCDLHGNSARSAPTHAAREQDRDGGPR